MEARIDPILTASGSLMAGRWMHAWLGSAAIHVGLLAGLGWLVSQGPVAPVPDPIQREPVPLLITMEPAPERGVTGTDGPPAVTPERRQLVARPRPSVRQRSVAVVTRPGPRRVARVSPRRASRAAPAATIRERSGASQEARHRHTEPIHPTDAVTVVNQTGDRSGGEASTAAIAVTVAQAVAPRIAAITNDHVARRPLPPPVAERQADVTIKGPAAVPGRLPAPVERLAPPEATVARAAPQIVVAEPVAQRPREPARLEERGSPSAVEAQRPASLLRAELRTSSEPGEPVSTATERVRLEDAPGPVITSVAPSRQVVVARTESRLAGDPGWVARLLRKQLSALKGYPQAARASQVEGRVVLRVIVRPDGELAGVQVTGSSGHEVLDRDAVSLLERVSPLALDRPLGRPYVVLAVPISYELR